MCTRPQPATTPGLRLHTSSLAGTAVVKLSGRLTSEVTAVLKTEVRSLIPRSKRIVLDLTELSRMDSSGLGAVVGLYVSARHAGCDLSLVNFNKQIRELLGLTHLLSALEACGNYMVKLP